MGERPREHGSTCVHVLARKHGEGLVLVAEHLDEHEIPDLEHVRIVLSSRKGGMLLIGTERSHVPLV
jgi:hypothetical protein